MRDPRLIGTWRSDKRKTAAEIASRRYLNSPRSNKLVEMFGKLELRYTRSRCYSRFRNHESVSNYKVVAKDESSVAIVSVTPGVGEEIWHIHFVGDHYWIYLGSSGMREFFKRVSN